MKVQLAAETYQCSYCLQLETYGKCSQLICYYLQFIFDIMQPLRMVVSRLLNNENFISSLYLSTAWLHYYT